MKKLFNLFLGIIIFFIFSFYPGPVQAATCNISTNPSPVTTNQKSINLEIDALGILVEGTRYLVRFQGSPHAGIMKEVSNGKISLIGLGREGTTFNTTRNFEARTYTILVQDSSQSTTFCTASFDVQQVSSGGTCNIVFHNTSFTVSENIVISAENLGGNPPDGRRVVLKRDRENGKQVEDFFTSVGELSSRLVIGKVEAGTYYIEVRSGQDPAAYRMCFTTFIVGKIGEKSGEVPSAPCKEITDPITKKKTFVCDTALGEISTDPASFIKSIFGILLSLAGGVALLLIIISGYRLMTSQGNPEKVQAAREQLTSAIVGLLFIIFSLAILTIIGVDILRIPGFR